MLSWRITISYGLGHAFNDLCGTMWFTYTLIFFSYVLKFTSIAAGTALLIGQFADAASTPIIGVFSDKKCCDLLERYGKRKTWHLLGTILVAGGFPFIYSSSIIEIDSESLLLIYYTFFIVIFQFGWACVQISHLSLAPEITSSVQERTSLMAIRYGVTIMSNILVYLLMWIVFKSRELTTQFNEEHTNQFRLVSLIIVAIGTTTTLVFHVGAKENKGKSVTMADNNNATENGSIKLEKSYFSLLREGIIYHTMSIYLVTQMFVNGSQVIIPLYLQTTLKMDPTQLAILPLVMYIASFATTIVIKKVNDLRGRKQSFFIAGPLVLMACVAVYFGRSRYYDFYYIHGTVLLFGCAGSIMSVTSLSIVADLVCNDTKNGAFIYSIMTFFDKISSGIVIMIIQYIQSYIPSQYYYKYVLIVLSAACTTGGIISIYFLPQKSETDKLPGENHESK